MGFGILIAGYYITYLVGMVWSAEIYGVLLILLGYLLMATALVRLMEYERGFRYALLLDALLCAPALYRIFAWLSENLLWDLSMFSGVFSEIAQAVELLLFVGYQITLLLAVRRLAREVELPKIATSAVRNLVVLGFYAALAIFVRIPLPAVKSIYPYLAGPTVLLQVVFYVLMGVMLVSCYMRISDEQDVDMPLKKSRFAWVNRVREERARREQAAADSTREYAESRLRKRQAEREQKVREQDRRKRK